MEGRWRGRRGPQSADGRVDLGRGPGAGQILGIDLRGRDVRDRDVVRKPRTENRGQNAIETYPSVATRHDEKDAFKWTMEMGKSRGKRRGGKFATEAMSWVG